MIGAFAPGERVDPNATIPPYDHPEEERRQPKVHIVRSKRSLDLSEPWQRLWYLNQVLLHGRSEDLATLDWEEVRRASPELVLPPEVRRLWEPKFSDEMARE